MVVKSLKSHGKLAQGPHVTVAWLQEHFSYLAARFTLVCSGLVARTFFLFGSSFYIGLQWRGHPYLN